MTTGNTCTKTVAARPRATAAEILRPPEARRFTARQIATHLALTDKAIKKRLPAADGTNMVRGQKALAWPVDALPTEWRDRLESLRVTAGFRSVEDFLASDASRQRWSPKEETVGGLGAEFIERATRRREVYAEALRREREEPAPTRAEILAIVRPRQKQVFGYPVADDRHDYVMKVARERDREFGEFHRVELYLEAAAFRAVNQAKEPVAEQSRHAPLLKEFEALGDRLNPDADDKATVLDRAFRHYDGLVASTANVSERRTIKRSLLDFLIEVFPCPILARTRAALEKTFNRDRATWIANGRDVDCLLPKGGGGRRAYECEECFAKVNEIARKIRGHNGMGNVSAAWRQLRTTGGLCQACSDHYGFNMSVNKSYVPAQFRIRATPNLLELAKDRGRKHMEAAGPKIVRDWSDTDPGDYFVSDDETSNHVVWTRINGELVIGRLQILHLMDLKTSYPIEFLAYFGPPTAEMIRRLLYQGLVNGVGMPHKGFLFEKGAYDARMIVGARSGELPFRFTDNGLRSRFGIGVEGMEDDARKVFYEGRELGLLEPALGVEVRQATRPWSKPIEGNLHILQKKMSSLRGFVGFNERAEIPDRLKGFEKACREGRANPDDEFPSRDEYVARYRSVLEEFRHEPQPKSIRLRGESPMQAWKDGLDRRPLRKLGADQAYLLATHKKPVRLKADGIALIINGQRYCYASRELGEWFGRGITEVLAFYNIEVPGLAHFSATKLKQIITLRPLSAPAMTARCTPEGRANLGECERSKRGFMAAATQRFSGLEHPVLATITRDDVHSETGALGRHINEATAAEKSRRADEQENGPPPNRLAEAHGIFHSGNAIASTRSPAMSEREKAYREQAAAEENAAVRKISV